MAAQFLKMFLRWLFVLSIAGTSFAQSITIAADVIAEAYSPMVREVVKSAGFDPTFRYFPSERSFQMLVGGHVDAEFSRTRVAVEPYKDKLILIGPIGCIEIAAYSAKSSNVKISSVTDLYSWRIGIVQSHKTSVDFAQRIHLPFVQVSARESLFHMLVMGRLDVVIDARTSALTILKKENLLDKVQQNGPVLDAEPLYFVVNGRNKEWAPRLQTAFDQAIQKKTWQRAVADVNAQFGLPAEFSLFCLK